MTFVAAIGVTHVKTAKAGPSNNLIYHGGPVLHTTHLYAIYWRPQFGCVSGD